MLDSNQTYLDHDVLYAHKWCVGWSDCTFYFAGSSAKMTMVLTVTGRLNHEMWTTEAKEVSYLVSRNFALQGNNYKNSEPSNSLKSISFSFQHVSGN